MRRVQTSENTREFIPAGGPRLRIVAEEPEGRSPESLLEGRYRLLDRLGNGGMATVYLGEHVAMGKRVAIKILNPELCRSETHRRRFLGEAKAASRLRSRHVIDVTDFGETPDGSVFLVMELLDGSDLSDLISRDAPMEAGRVRNFGLQICTALQEAHESGILHRDLKPGNCYVTRHHGREHLTVLDFGLAKIARDTLGSSLTLTRVGSIMGTPEYMAPEQARGEAADERADVYAIGVMLYHMATGSLPFQSKDVLALLHQHCSVPPQPPRQRRPDVPISPELEAVILKAMEKDPAARFQSAAALARALAQVPVSRRRRPFAKREIAWITVALAEAAVMLGAGLAACLG